MVEEHLTRMTEELGLTDEQVVQVRPIVEGQVAKMRTLREKYQQQGRRPSRSAREEMEGLRKEAEQRLEAVLTEAQMRTCRQKAQERRERRGGGGGGRGGGPPW